MLVLRVELKTSTDRDAIVAYRVKITTERAASVEYSQAVEILGMATVSVFQTSCDYYYSAKIILTGI